MSLPSEAPLRMLIVDDHPMVREGLRSMLAGEAVEIVGEAGDGAEALRRAEALAPEVILLDLELPDMDGLSVLRRIREAAPAAAVLVVTMHEDPGLVRRAVQAGAAGYMLKGVDRPELLAGISAARDGRAAVDPRLLRAALTPDPPQRVAPVALSRVELDVLQLIAEGFTNREIGARLRWSYATAKKYVQRVLEKLAVTDRTQAAVEAVKRGLLR